MKTFAKVLAVGAAALIAMPATALTYVFNDGGSAFADGALGTVELTQSGANVNFTVTLAAPFNFVDTGNAHDLFTFNGTGIVLADISGITVSAPIPAGVTFSAVTAGSNSPFGNFGFGIVCNGCNGGSDPVGDPLRFTVANAVLSDFAILSTSGSPNAYFAADVITQGVTGAIGVTGGPIPAIPEPSTYALMFAGLAAVGFMARRRRQV